MAKLDQLLKELEQRPSDRALLLTIAGLYERRGDWENAATLYARIVEVDAHDGFFLKAIALAKHLVTRSPQRLGLKVRLGEFHARLGLRPEARAWFEAARDGFLKAGRRAEAMAVQAQIEALVSAGELDEAAPKAKA